MNHSSEGGIPEVVQLKNAIAHLKKEWEVRPSGLIVPSNTLRIPTSTPLTDSKLILPSTLEHVEPTTLKLETKEEVVHSAQTVDAPARRRPQSEIVLADYNLPQFLAREISNKYDKKSGIEPDLMQEVIVQVDSLSSHKPKDEVREQTASKLIRRPKETIARRNKTVEYYDKAADTKQKRTTSQPGALETAALTIVDLLQEPEFNGELGDKALVCLSELLYRYRAQTDQGFELPEMPDLVQHLTGALDVLGEQTHSRGHIYDLLSQFAISPKLGSEIMEKMDKFEDLDHSLAYQITLSIAQANPEASWIKLQHERRKVLLEKLKGSNQEVFDQYDDLLRQSKHLVIAGDLLSVEPGKVGMEVEYGIKGSLPSDKNLPKSWSSGQDHINGEVRRSDDYLNHDEVYRESLVGLSKWFVDNHSRPDSLHIHLDRQLHPHKPYLGGLYELGRSHGKSNVHESDMNTWEIRGNAIPRAGDILEPARIEDLIEMYLQATQVDTIESTSQKIQPNDSEISYSKLIFGHIASCLPSEEGRLALLMSLHDPRTLRAVNPVAFAQTYDEASLTNIAVLARLESDLPAHQINVNLLQIAGEAQFGKGWLQINKGVDESPEQAFIREAMNNPLNLQSTILRSLETAESSSKVDLEEVLSLFLWDEDRSLRSSARSSYKKGNNIERYPEILRKLATSDSEEDRRFMKELLRSSDARRCWPILLNEERLTPQRNTTFIDIIDGKIVVDTGTGTWRYTDGKVLSQAEVDMIQEIRRQKELAENNAKALFGKDFVGVDTYRQMEQKCKAQGIDVQFMTDGVEFPYTPEQLKQVEGEGGTDRERFLVMRPSGVKFKDEAGEYDGPITISALKRLFRDKNPFGDGTLIYDNSWYRSEAFIDQPLQAKYAMPTKKLLPESRGKNWSAQEKLLKPGETRREAIETLWDTIAYYATTKERLLSDGYDWSNSSASYARRVCVGYFGQYGIYVLSDDPSSSYSHLGICPAK